MLDFDVARQSLLGSLVLRLDFNDCLGLFARIECWPPLILERTDAAPDSSLALVTATVFNEGALAGGIFRELAKAVDLE